MNLDYLKLNIKFENLKSLKLNFFAGTFIHNYNANLLIFKKKKINKTIKDNLLLENINSEFSIFSNNFKKNSFYMYFRGVKFLDNSHLNEKIIFITPKCMGISANIYTTIISIKLINDIKIDLEFNNSNNKINDNLEKYSEEIIIKIFGFLIKYDKKNVTWLFYTNYIKKIFELEDNYKINNELYIIVLKLLQTEIKINFIINLIFKFNENFNTDNLINFYNFLFDNLSEINNINANLINNFFGNNIINNIEIFDEIIYKWIIYIDLCNKCIRLLNIISVVNSKTIDELSEKKINKNYIIDTLINSQTYNMYKISKLLLN